MLANFYKVPLGKIIICTQTLIFFDKTNIDLSKMLICNVIVK